MFWPRPGRERASAGTTMRAIVAPCARDGAAIDGGPATSATSAAPAVAGADSYTNTVATTISCRATRVSLPPRPVTL